MSDTSDIWSVLRGLEGVDDKLLKHPAFAQLPSLLEDGEIPESVARNGKALVYVATDRRIIHFKTDFWQKSISTVISYPYNDITAFRADMTFGCKMTINGDVKLLPMKKGDRQRFATVVRSHVPAHQTDESISGQPAQPSASPMSGKKKAVLWTGGILGLVVLLTIIGALTDEGEEGRAESPKPKPVLACPNDAEQDYFSKVGSQGLSAFTLLTMFGEELQTTANYAPWDILDENWIYARETDIMVMDLHFDGLIALQSPASVAHIDRKVEDMARQVKRSLLSTNAVIQTYDIDMIDIVASQMAQVATKAEALRLAIDSFCR